MGLRCLGDWEGHDGQKYLALWDPEVTTDHQPRYRCAVSKRGMRDENERGRDEYSDVYVRMERCIFLFVFIYFLRKRVA